MNWEGFSEEATEFFFFTAEWGVVWIQDFIQNK